MNPEAAERQMTAGTPDPHSPIGASPLSGLEKARQTYDQLREETARLQRDILRRQEELEVLETRLDESRAAYKTLLTQEVERVK